MYRAGTQGKQLSVACGGIVFLPDNFPKCVRSSTAEHRVANAETRVRCPPSAPVFTRWAPVCAVESPKLDVVGAAPTRRAIVHRGHMCRSGETVSQSVCGGCNSHCLHQVHRAMFRPAVCRTAVAKQGRKTTSGALPPSPTNYDSEEEQQTRLPV